MRRIVDAFIQISQEIRDEDNDRWDADMYGLVLAMREAGLEIHTEVSLGVCNHWRATQHENTRIIHYPWPVFDRAGRMLFFKQEFTRNTQTRPWARPPLPSRATNRVEARLLEVVHEYIDHQSAEGEVERARAFWKRMGK